MGEMLGALLLKVAENLQSEGKLAEAFAVAWFSARVKEVDARDVNELKGFVLARTSDLRADCAIRYEEQ